MNRLRRFFFKKAVRVWRSKIRLYRELVKEIKRLQGEILTAQREAARAEDPTRVNGMVNDFVTKLNVTALDLFMPDYRQLDDELRNEHIKRLLNRRRYAVVGKPHHRGFHT